MASGVRSSQNWGSPPRTDGKDSSLLSLNMGVDVKCGSPSIPASRSSDCWCRRSGDGWLDHVKSLWNVIKQWSVDGSVDEILQDIWSMTTRRAFVLALPLDEVEGTGQTWSDMGQTWRPRKILVIFNFRAIGDIQMYTWVDYSDSILSHHRWWFGFGKSSWNNGTFQLSELLQFMQNFQTTKPLNPMNYYYIPSQITNPGIPLQTRPLSISQGFGYRNMDSGVVYSTTDQSLRYPFL